MKKIGLIGVGNMGGAILRGMLKAEWVHAKETMICVRNREKAQALKETFPGLTATEDAVELTAQCHMVMLAVKPQGMGALLDQIRPVLPGRAVVSIAAGWTMQMLSERIHCPDTTLLRAMPNTPALVGAGMTALCEQTTFNAVDFAFAKGIFDAVGKTVVVREQLFDGVIALSGSSPAYLFMLMEAMADAGVREGLPRALCYEMAAQVVYGSAKLVLETGRHPAQLKDEVCSPGGTTIEAVTALEKAGFRAAVQEAMAACAEKSREMSK